jgi:predicted nuclease of predicted toxin-antitoxin system
MILLLDECLPRRLKRDFSENQVFTVEDAGLKGLANGELLQAASGKYDVLVTVDVHIPAQQKKLASLKIALLILRARNNKYTTLKELVPRALVALEDIHPGDIVFIE